MNPEELFRANLSLIERVIGGVCRRAGLHDADAEDFGSMVKLALIENDYAILRGYEGRAPLGAFLTVVAQRVLSRERTRAWGRWRPSAEVERLGPAAVLLEKLLARDGRSLAEAIPIVRAFEPLLGESEVRALADRLPPRHARPRLVPLPDSDLASHEVADARVHERETREISERAARVVRDTLAALPRNDRMLLRFHFGAQMSIADASRILGVPQRPLYRRLEALLRQLRTALENSGAGAAAVQEVISAGASAGLDFGLSERKNDSGRHTSVPGDGV